MNQHSPKQEWNIAYLQSLAMHIALPVFLVGLAFLLDRFWQRPQIHVIPEYLEVTLMEDQPVKKAAAKPVKKTQPEQPKPKPEKIKPEPQPEPPKPEEPKPEPIKLKEPKPDDLQPELEKTSTPKPTAEPTAKPATPKPTPKMTATPKLTPKASPSAKNVAESSAPASKKPSKKTPPPLPSLDDQLDNLLDEEEESLQELKNSRNKAAEAEATADARRSEEQSMVGHYSALIRDRVEAAWSRPPSARPGMETVLQVKLLPGGEVRDVEVVKSSGDQAFDYSALKAIREAHTLPVPEDNSLFNRYFRVIQFPFRPEDLQR